MGGYSLLIKPSAGKELQAVGGKGDRLRIVQRIQALIDDPRPPGSEKLAGYDDRYRDRQGNYRVGYLSMTNGGRSPFIVLAIAVTCIGRSFTGFAVARKNKKRAGAGRRNENVLRRAVIAVDKGGRA